MTEPRILHFPEPLLGFGYDQRLDDPRDGLFLFGPLIDARKPSKMRIGVVGTLAGIESYRSWVKSINAHIAPVKPEAAHQIAYPGFEAAFRTEWAPDPVVEVAVSAEEISRALRISDRHIAIYEAVSIYEREIRELIRRDDYQVDVWFAVVPEEVYLLGRPMSKVRMSERIPIDSRFNARIGRRFIKQPSMFSEDMEAAAVYQYEINFHHQLKARLLDTKAVVQIVRETSITPPSDETSYATRRLQDEATIAWNLTTTSFFKAGGRPWKLADVRNRVCYIGLVFKVDPSDPSGESACCGAQMFLDSGDGLVFKGALGRWYSRDTREFHLSKRTAAELLSVVLAEYRKIHDADPNELFIHAKTRLNSDEWAGFVEAAPATTNVVGVRITRSSDVKLYRPGSNPVIRGTALVMNPRRAYLWTAGYVPRLKTYAGREVPNPLSIEIVRGDADLRVVLADVMSLTKVNFNACIYADGLPVTLRFADAIGEILTAGPEFDLPPLPFRHYI